MSDELYRQNIIDRFHSPQFKGELDSYDLSAEEVNPLCGDKLSVAVRLEGNRVAAASWMGDGCAISLAAADFLCQRMVGLSIDEIEALTSNDMVGLLGIEVPPARLKCATLALVTAHKLAA